MLQRLIAALLGLSGIAAAALGIASATAWRADDPLVASATADTATLVTEPGVLEVAGEPVTITVRAGDSPVVLAIGRDTDVSAWISDDPHDLVTGLADWHELALSAGGSDPTATATQEATASASSAAAAAAEPSPSASGDDTDVAVTAADPTGSDMWVTQAVGDGSASLEWTPPDSGRWSLIAVSLGDTNPTLELSWPQDVTTPWLWPGVALGVLLLAVAGVLAVRIHRAASGADWHDVSTGTISAIPASPAAGAATAPAAPTTTGTIPLIDPATGLPMTRRQIREAEAAASRRGRRGATGAIPAVTGTTPVVPSNPPEETPARGTGADDVSGARTPETDASGHDDDAGNARRREWSASGRRSLFGRRSPDTPSEQVSALPSDTARTGTPDRLSDVSESDRTVPGAPGAAGGAASGGRHSSAPAVAAESPGEQPDGGADRAAPPEPGATTDPQSASSDASQPGTQRRGLGDLLPWRRQRASFSGPGQASDTALTQAATPAEFVSPSDGTSAASGVDEEAGGLASTQRADSWRRMWGFPSDAVRDQTDTDHTDREEDR